MIRTLIIDDEPAIRKDIQTLLSRHEAFICIGTCGSVAEAKVLIETTKPDLVLLDIQLSDGTGFQLLQHFKPVTFRVIFITAYSDHAIKAIKFGALDYLVKPIDEDEFATALLAATDMGHTNTQLDIAIDHLKPAKLKNRIALRSQNYLQIVQYAEIIYCQSYSGYTTFYLSDKRKILTSKPIGEYEELLPITTFIRPHQSYLVNLDYIDRFHKDNYLILKKR